MTSELLIFFQEKKIEEVRRNKMSISTGSVQ